VGDALSGLELLALVNPEGELVAPQTVIGDLEEAPLHDLDRDGRGDDISAFGSSGLRRAVAHCDQHAILCSGKTVQTGFGEVHGAPWSVNSHGVVLVRNRRDRHDQRALAEVENGSLAVGIPAERHGVEADRGVLIDPHHRAIGELDLDPGLSRRVDPVARDNRHVDERLELLLLSCRLDGDVTFEIGNVAQGGRGVLCRGHNRAGKETSKQ